MRGRESEVWICSDSCCFLRLGGVARSFCESFLAGEGAEPREIVEEGCGGGGGGCNGRLEDVHFTLCSGLLGADAVSIDIFCCSVRFSNVSIK